MVKRTDEAMAPEGPLCSLGQARALAFATGVLYFLAFPGIDIWPLAFVAWVPLLLAMHGRSTRTCTALAWISGVTMTFIGFYWMLDMLRNFSGMPTLVCVLLMVLLAAFQGGRIALFGFLAARAAALGWRRGAALALAFAVSEWAYPLLFPWYYGATVHQVPALIQTAELGGPILVGLSLFGLNVAIAETVKRRLTKERLPVRLLAFNAAMVLLSAVYGVVRMAQVDDDIAKAESGLVGVVQANMGLMQKRTDYHEGLRRHIELSQDLENEGPLDLIVWSETSVARGVYEDQAAEYYQRVLTSQLKTPVLFGALLLRDVDDARGTTLFNSALMSDPDGKIVGRYDKHALLPFGEYLPLGEAFPILYEWSPNTGRFSKGDTLAPLPLGEHRVSAHICYEDVLPGFVNDLVAQSDDVDLLVNMTNDAWYGDTTQPWIHLALAKFRAVEHRRFLVRSTNSGVSAFVDAAGRVLAHTGTFEEVSKSHRVAYLSPSKTLYERVGDVPYLLAFLLLATCCWKPPAARIPGFLKGH